MTIFRDIFRYAKHKNTVIIILILALLISMDTCSNKDARIANLETKISIDSLDYQVLINKKGEKIAIQEKKIISDKKMMKELTDNVNGLRKINSQIKATVHTQVINVKADPVREVKTIRDTVLIDNKIKIKHYLQLPQAYSMPDNKWITIKYSIDTLGISKIDSALFITKPTISCGYKDEGTIKNIFKKNIPVVSYKDENPYSNVKGFTNLEYKPKTKWYNKKIVTFSAGIVAGIILLK